MSFTKSGNKIFLYILSFFTLIFVSCNDQPTDLGYTLLYDTVSVAAINSKDMPIILGHESFTNRQQLFSVGVIYIGRATDSKALSILRFMESNMPDSLIGLDESKINSVTLTLWPLRYAFGDLTGNPVLSFKIFEAVKYWTNKTTWDTLFEAGTPSSYFDTKVLGQYSGQINLQDNMPQIDIPLDKSFIPKWIKMQRDSVPIWGLALVPDDNSGVINQFSAIKRDKATMNPTLTVIYNNFSDTLIINSAINSSFVNAKPVSSDEFIIQGAVFNRSILNFDVSMIPPFSAIHQAQLELTVDDSNTQTGNYELDSLLEAGLYLSPDSAKLKVFPDVPYYAKFDKEKRKYIFERVVSAVEYFARITDKNVWKLVFSAPDWDEYYRMDRVAFYGSNEPDSSKKPKLKIIYSTRPPQR